MARPWVLGLDKPKALGLDKPQVLVQGMQVLQVQALFTVQGSNWPPTLVRWLYFFHLLSCLPPYLILSSRLLNHPFPPKQFSWLLSSYHAFTQPLLQLFAHLPSLLWPTHQLSSPHHPSFSSLCPHFRPFNSLSSLPWLSLLSFSSTLPQPYPSTS